MPLFFMGLMDKLKKKEEAENADETRLSRARELLASYDKLRSSVLLDTIRVSEGLLDSTGLSDIDRTLWGAEFPQEDEEDLAQDKENVEAVICVVKRFYHYLTKKDEKMTELNYEMKELLTSRGTNFTDYNDSQISVFRRATKVSEEIRTFLMIAVLDEEGKLTEQAKKKADEMIG